MTMLSFLHRHAPAPADPFHLAFRGRFSNLLTWEALDALWARLRERAGAGWYVYAVGMEVPTLPSSPAELRRFIDAVDALLRREHPEDYCGIVYVDDKDDPGFVKIFDPHHLGVSCGFSTHPPLPGWILSRLPPAALHDNRALPMNRQRWWREIWG
jgi:hypothetical protein